MAVLLATLLTLAPSAHAIPDDTAGQPVVPGRCRPSAYTVAATMVVVGLPLARSTVEVNADSAKLAAVGLQDACDEVYARIPRFRWSVVARPRGQRATLTETRTLSPRVTLGGAGRYRIRLTACPSGCTVTVPPYGMTHVNASSRDITIDAVESIVLPPESAPIRPPFEPRTDPTDFSRRSPNAASSASTALVAG